MIVDSERIFGKKGKSFVVKSKVLRRRKGGEKRGLSNSPLGIIAILIIVPALLLGGSYLLKNRVYSQRFIIKEIIVEGNEFVSGEKILAASGAMKGADLYNFDIYSAKFRIEKIPQILTASVRRKLPDTIMIQVVERSARAIVKLDVNGLSVCVDPEGVLLPNEASGGLDDITVIYGVEIAEPKTGRRINDGSLITALTILKLHDNSGLRNQVNVEILVMEKNGEICIHEREKAPSRRLYKVSLGKENFEQRLANLSEILKEEFYRQDKMDRKIDLTFERPLSVPIGAEGGL